MQIAVCNLYPNDYWGLDGVRNIDAPPELWWSSRERQAFEGGLPTSEYLEIDFGRLRSMNFLNFNILQKPIDITVEYDVWGFDSGIKFWQPVTRVANERFDNSVEFTPNSANPWKNCQFYYTNSKGDLLTTRYMRVRFDRRDEPWPNGDAQNTFPWSIDVKNFRTARYVIDLNDTRGVLVQQGKVTAPIIDPIHYEDLSGAVPTLVGVVSGVEVNTPSASNDNETYMNFMVSSASNGNEVGGSTGGGGATWSQVTGSAAHARVRVDANEAGHVLSDLPESYYHYQFFTAQPTDEYGVFYAIGESGSVGVQSTTVHTPWPSDEGTSATATNAGYPAAPSPLTGDLVLCFISVRSGETASAPTDTSGNPYTLVHTFTSPGNVTSYVYKRTAGAAEPVLAQTAVLSGSASWSIMAVLLSTPSSTNIYVMDESPYILTSPPGENLATQIAVTHG